MLAQELWIVKMSRHDGKGEAWEQTIDEHGFVHAISRTGTGYTLVVQSRALLAVKATSPRTTKTKAVLVLGRRRGP